MPLWTRRDRAEFGQLHAFYGQAWQQLCLEVRRRQFLLSNTQADGIGILLAEEAVRQAEGAYRQARNALADYLLSQLSTSSPIRTRDVSNPSGRHVGCNPGH